MNRSLLTIVAVLLLFLGPSLMAAQQAAARDQIVGTWTLVSEDITNDDGSHTAPFGTNPKGIVIFDANGHYALQLIRPDLPRFVSNNRTKGTPEENRAVVQGTLSHFGKYSAAGGNIVFDIENSSFPNWSGDHQERPFTVSGDELTWRTLPASGGGKAVLVWKRAK